MRTNPDRKCAIAAALFVLTLAGCAATPSEPQAQAGSPLMSQLAGRLPGQYTSVISDDRPVQRLRVERGRSPQPGQLELRMVQSGAGDEVSRSFILRLAGTSLSTRLDGQLALLGPDGQARRSCPMVFQATDDGLVGETDPDSCRFGEGKGAVGLLKEIAFDGRSLVVGDRIVDLETGAARGSDQLITFLPAPEFSGWAGIREGGQWRVAEEFGLSPGDAGVIPIDAADMTLGIRADLQYYRLSRENGTVLLRLTLRDSEGGELLGEAWAEPGSAEIGIALPDLQVGLSRSSGR